MNIKKVFDCSFNFTNFLKGLEDSYAQMLASMYESSNLDEETLEKIKNLQEDTNILIFAEGWCPDCIINIPPIAAMEGINDKIKVRIACRDGNEQYLEKYKVSGRIRIPVIVVMDGDFFEKGHIVEMPSAVKNIVENGLQQEIIVAKRKYKKGFYGKDMVDEIIGLIDSNEMN